MFVPCPHCGFLVALIVRPDGQAQRCPRCDGVVQGLEADGVEPDTVELPTAEVATDAPIETGMPVEAEPSDEATALPDDTDAPSVVEPAVETTLDDAVPTPGYDATIAAVAAGTAPPRARRRARPRRKGAPSFARHTVVAAPKRTSWRTPAAIAGLTLLLALQLLLAQRNDLAADPRWRPFVAGMCTVLRCELPPWREPSAFTMLQRSVRPRAGENGVLAVEASFRNDARWPQPWPVLTLSLSDIDGRQVGLRAFTPEEYRRAHRSGDQLLPGQSATVSMDIVEPAPRIVAFTFDFR